VLLLHDMNNITNRGRQGSAAFMRTRWLARSWFAISFHVTGGIGRA